MTGYLVLELRRARRDPRYLLLVVGWPAAAYLLFSTIFGANSNRSEGLDPHVEIMVAMATFGAMGAVLLATGPPMATDRQIGWLRQLRLTPLSATQVLTVRVLAALLLSLPAVALTFAAAAGVKGVSLPLWEWPTITVLLVVGSLPFAAIGVLLGGLTSGDGATGITMIGYVVLALVGGLWVPLHLFPPALQTVGRVLPSEQLAQLGWHLARGQAPPLAAVGVLLAWFAAASLGAIAVARRSTLLAA